MSDKRSVSTDALDTLGTLLTGDAARDAIHLAVEPVVAGCDLSPGQDIYVDDGVAWAAPLNQGLGIVDPFLAESFVKKGQRFWFVMRPRLVHSLRHVWHHPAFPSVTCEVSPSSPAASSDPAASEQWLRAFCARSDCPSYEQVMRVIANGSAQLADPADYGPSMLSDTSLYFDGLDAHGDIPPEFWHHAEIVLGRKVDRRPLKFSCSC